MKADLGKYRQSCCAEHAGLSGKEREEQVLKYAPLIHFIANRLAMRLPPSVSKDELFSAGIVGLLDAVDKFDANLGIQFKTYAEHRVRGAMLDDLRKMDWFPRSLRKDIQKVEDAILALETKLGREPQDQEVARELGVGMEEYFKMIQRVSGAGLMNIDDVVLDGAGGTNGAQGPETPTPLDDLKAKEMKAAVAKALRGLSDMEQKVMSLYYYDELTLKEIAEVFHLTESRISQIHSKAIVRLRTKLRDYHGS